MTTRASVTAATARANAAYEDLVEAAELRDIKLVESEFRISPEIMSPDVSTWKFGYNCEVGETTYDPEANIITAWVHAMAFCRSGRKRILNCKAKYLLAYTVSQTVETAAAERFTHTVGPFSVYPYFRSHFAELTAQGGALVPPLPIMRGARRAIRAWGNAPPDPDEPTN